MKINLSQFNLMLAEEPKIDEQITQFISLVPKHLRKYIKQGIFIIPSSLLIEDYQHKKDQYLQKIADTKQQSVNSMHKYTSVNPISSEDISKINMIIRGPLNKYYSANLKHYQFKNKQPELFAAFAISYDKGHKGLNIHIDDSSYTVNLCLSNTAIGNQVVFNELLQIDPIQDYALIHTGKIPHHTNELLEGQRTNVVIWFK